MLEIAIIPNYYSKFSFQYKNWTPIATVFETTS